MKYCILGSTGMLGRALIKECNSRSIDVIGVARKNSDCNIDIKNDIQVEKFLKQNSFDVVINTVAIVNHKFCDDNKGEAYLVNARPSSILAALADKLNYKYVYISTDGYFFGDKDMPHNEEAQVDFLNEYARTKFIGEQFALVSKNSLVVRTNIVGFKNLSQPTFVEWVINSIKQNEEITLFDDYFTSSIPVSLFSKILLDLINKNCCGLYNVASKDVTSKKDFILNLAKVFNLDLKNYKIGSVSSLSSKRADSLGLDCTKAETVLKYNMPSLDECLTQLKRDYENV